MLEEFDGQVAEFQEKQLDSSLLLALHRAIDLGFVEDGHDDTGALVKGVATVLDEVGEDDVIDYLVAKHPFILNPRNVIETYYRVDAIRRAAEHRNPNILQYMIARMSAVRWPDVDEWDPKQFHEHLTLKIIDVMQYRYGWFTSGNYELSQSAVKCAQFLDELGKVAFIMREDQISVLLRLLERTGEKIGAYDDTLPIAVVERLKQYDQDAIWSSADVIHEVGVRLMGGLLALKLKAEGDPNVQFVLGDGEEEELGALASEFLFGPVGDSFEIVGSRGGGRVTETVRIVGQSAIYRMAREGLPLDITEFLDMSAQWHLPHEGLPKEIYQGKPERAWHPLLKTNDPIGLETLQGTLSLVELTAASQLEKEGEVMEHCVGRGHYEDLCCAGTSHIFSIRGHDNASIATLELHYNQWQQRWVVQQVNGIKNERVSGHVRDAVERFAKSVNEDSQALNRNRGETEESRAAFAKAGWTSVDALVGYKVTPETVRMVLRYYLHMAWGSRKAGIRSLFAPMGIIETYDGGGARVRLYQDWQRQRHASLAGVLKRHGQTFDLLLDNFLRSRNWTGELVPVSALLGESGEV